MQLDKNGMKKIIQFFKNNILYITLAIFMLLINFSVFVENNTKSSENVLIQENVAKENIASDDEKIDLFDEKEVKKREDKIQGLAKDNPTLYFFIGMVNLLIILMFCLGFGIDCYLGARILSKKPININILRSEKPLWGVGDIVKVVLLFMSFGYCSAIFEMFLIKIFPIFQNNNFRMIFSTAIINTSAILIVFYFVRVKSSQTFEVLGLTKRGLSKSFLYAFIGYLSILPIVAIIMVVTIVIIKIMNYSPPLQPIVEIFLKEKGSGILIFSSVFAAIFGPITEEIFFRGFMYGAVKNKVGILGAILGTSLIFSVLHAHIVGFMPIFVLGILLAYLREKTGSLIPSIFVHVAHNLGMIILVFLMKVLG